MTLDSYMLNERQFNNKKLLNVCNDKINRQGFCSLIKQSIVSPLLSSADNINTFHRIITFKSQVCLFQSIINIIVYTWAVRDDGPLTDKDT